MISLELLTVFGAGPLAVWICYSIAKRDPKVNIWMIVIATAELYGGEFAIDTRGPRTSGSTNMF